MIDCRKCKFYFVTWRKKFPHGCRGMGFMSLELPSAFVQRVSGEPCQMFERKEIRRSALASRKPGRPRTG